MDFTTRYKNYRETEQSLDNHLLGHALELMEEDMKLAPEWDNSNEWTDIKDTFNYMLDYLKKGITDEHKDVMFKQLLERSYRLNDRLLQSFRAQNVPDGIELLRRDLELGSFPTNMTSLLPEIIKWGNIMHGVEVSPLDDPAGDTNIIRNYENFYIHLFNAIFTSSLWEKDDLQAVLKLLNNPDVYKYDLLLVESAVMMSLCAYYDEAKLKFLVAVVRQEHDYSIQTRAITGIALCCMRHSAKMMLNENLVDILTKDLPENPVYIEGMRLLQRELFLCQQTDSASRKLDEDIIPAMMKSTYFRPTKFGFQNVEDYLNPKDSDPNEDASERKDIEKKLREISDMHVNGLDVYMTTFSHLKNFPFFDALANWFYPFNPYHYTVKGIYFAEGKKTDFLSTILQGIMFCDSDKYSFSMLLGKIGTMERKVIETQLSAGLEKQELNNLLQANRGLQFMMEIRSYLQDLYRFYKLCPMVNASLMFNPFTTDMNFLHNSVLSRVIDDTDSKFAIAEAVYKVGNYDEALVYLRNLDKSGSQNASVYQREGYCFQALHQYKEAVDAYLKADLIKPGEMWTYRQLGYCYRHLREYDKALGFYLKIEASDPDNKFVLLRTGECLLQEERYEEAQQRFFKVEYNEPEYLPALRAIAWCAFLSGDLERARKYYGKILDRIKQNGGNQVNAEWATDYLNAGHTAVASGHLGEAILLYKQYAGCSKERDFQELWDDYPILRDKYHCNRLDVQLIVEAVRSEL